MGGNNNLNYTSSNTNDLITDGVGDSKFKGNYVLNSEVLDIANVDLMNPFSNTTAIYVTNQSANNSTGLSTFSSEGGIYNCTVNPGDNYKPTVGAFFAGSYLDEHTSSSLTQSAPSLIEWLSAGGSSTGSNGDYAILNGPMSGGNLAKKISGSWYYAGAVYATQQHSVQAYSGYRVFNSTAKHISIGFYLDSWRNNAYVENNQFIDVDSGFRSVVSDISLTSSYNNVVIKNNYVKLARHDRSYIYGHGAIFYGIDQSTSSGSILRHIDNLVIENNIFELPISSSKSIYQYPPFVFREYPRYVGLWFTSEVYPSGSQPNLHRSVLIKNNNFVNWNPVKSELITGGEAYGYNVPFFFNYSTSSADFDTSDNPAGPFPNSLIKFKNKTLSNYIIEGNIYNDSIYPSTSSIVPITFNMVGTGNQYYYPVDQVSRLGSVTATTLANGYQVLSSGNYSHAEGSLTTASGDYSHAEGIQTKATGQGANSKGGGTLSSGAGAHSEGIYTTASANYSHAEGHLTEAASQLSHAVGSGSWAGYSIFTGLPSAASIASHAEGLFTRTSGVGSHSEGSGSIAAGVASHAEGQSTIASGIASHAEGFNTTASGNYSHAEGRDTHASGSNSHAEGSASFASGITSHAEGKQTHASGSDSHAEGFVTIARGSFSHAEGYSTVAYNTAAHAEGSQTHASGSDSHSEGYQTSASGEYSHAEGYNTTARGNGSHVEGSYTFATGSHSHAEGYYTSASGNYSHAEGFQTIVSGIGAHVEGFQTTASANYSHAEGQSTTAIGQSSHAEGQSTTANGLASHAEGFQTLAIGPYSHAEGLSTTASADYQHVSGKFNVTSSNTNNLFIIGNGTSNISRSNVLVVDTGSVTIGGYGGLILAPDIFHNFGEGGQLSLCDSQSRVTYMIDEINDTYSGRNESLMRISAEGYLETNGRATLRQGSIALSVAIQDYDVLGNSSSYSTFIQTPLYISSSRHIFTSNEGNVGLGMVDVYRNNPITPSERLHVSGNIIATGFVSGSSGRFTSITSSNVSASGFVSASTVAANSIYASSFTSSLTSAVGYSGYMPSEFMVAVSDEISNIATGNNKLRFIFPFTLTGSTLTAYVHTAPVGSQITCSVTIGGSTISASIGTSAKSGSASATYYITKYQEVLVNITQVGSTTAGQGLKLIFEGMRKI